jgi:2-dehydro-3-deoxyphosphogluconate aldolase/(4S)-4-hydroxy-2-oxoglutarate aldolase
MQDPISKIKHHRLVPVVALQSAADALPLSDALAAGGLPIIEITYRTPAADDAIRAVAKAGRVLVGAGTVLNVVTAQRAIDSGASFIVSPGLSPKVVEFCLSKKMPIIPGGANATDLQLAIGEYDLPLVKFFPAEGLGGVKMIKLLSLPYTTARFMCTGGITQENLKTYLTCPQVDGAGGGWMTPPELIAGKQWDEIRKLAALAVGVAKEVGKPA